MPTNLSRVTVSLSDTNFKRVSLVKQYYGITISAQIQSLIAKYSEAEYGKIDERRLKENDAFKA